MIHDADVKVTHVHRGNSTCLGSTCPDCVAVEAEAPPRLDPRGLVALQAAAAMGAFMPRPRLREDPVTWWGSQRSKSVTRAEREARKAKKKAAAASRRRNRR